MTERRGGPRVPGPAPGALLSDTASTVFRLNAQFLAVADRMAAPAGLTAARSQVLGTVLTEPLPVSAVARIVGITRQSVQRVADLLVDDGLAVYEPNPAHRRAKLLAATDAGRVAIADIGPGHAALASRLRDALGGTEEFAAALATLTRLSEALEALGDDAADGRGEAEEGKPHRNSPGTARRTTTRPARPPVGRPPSA
ncbi:MarR family winged helix-turn-helix transcriptional regulator [Streptomyces hainanensis]|uniref:MarR family transcriptional regulator n=1 Tax=Streptomyces hainanensis TaxID=402648 RepID=A0A4R4SP48_9ACTN|nr:MarR family winged helix-turn-helix transcriptional regulator [Streptomyces hainanensis]TDC64766.1 MarR family transcriptional regulator [Streptomyces hainanensis]